MAFLNSATIIGGIYNIKKIDTKSGKSMASFVIRTYEKFGADKEKVTFFNCLCYGGIADNVLKNAKDKESVYIDGRFDAWKDKDGLDKYSIQVQEFKFLGGSKEVA